MARLISLSWSSSRCPLTLTPRLRYERWFFAADAALAWSVSGYHDASLWESLLKEIGKRKPADLAHASFANYLALYQAIEGADAVRVRGLVVTANTLYEARRTNRFFARLAYCEQGDAADYHVDYRLAVLLRYALKHRSSLVDGIESIHRWKW